MENDLVLDTGAATTEPQAAELASPVTVSAPPIMPAVVDLSTPEAQSMIMAAAEQRAAVILAERQHEQDIVSLATRLTGGRACVPICCARPSWSDDEQDEGGTETQTHDADPAKVRASASK